MSAGPRLVAIQGIGFTPIAMAIQGLLAEEEEETPPPPPSSGGYSSAPWHWVPFNPVHPRRPRKKRQQDILFCTH